MQTFLPYANVRKSMKVLDSRRLGKQRVEAFQILNIVLGRATGGWRNHPAIKMWRSNPNALKVYLNETIREWIGRGYRNTMRFEVVRGKVVFPKWFGSRKFHAAHRSNLLRKDWEHYSKFGWKECDDLDYVWP